MNSAEITNNKKHSILLVDDDPVLRLLMSNLLAQQNYQIHEATNGVSALSIFETHAPNLVLTDVNMPVMDGIELITKIRESNNETPIIVMSARENNLQQATQAGANMSAIKPINFRTLIPMIESLIWV